MTSRQAKEQLHKFQRAPKQSIRIWAPRSPAWSRRPIAKWTRKITRCAGNVWSTKIGEHFLLELVPVWTFPSLIGIASYHLMKGFDRLSRQSCLDCHQCARLGLRDVYQVNSVQSPSELAKAYLEDPHIDPVYKAVKGRKHCDTSLCGAETCQKAGTTDSGWGTSVKYVSTRSKESRVVCFVPGGYRKDTIESIHSQANLRFTKTLEQVRLQWSWPGMAGIVPRMITNWALYQQAKVPNKRVIMWKIIYRQAVPETQLLSTCVGRYQKLLKDILRSYCWLIILLGGMMQ